MGGAVAKRELEAGGGQRRILKTETTAILTDGGARGRPHATGRWLMPGGVAGVMALCGAHLAWRVVVCLPLVRQVGVYI